MSTEEDGGLCTLAQNGDQLHTPTAIGNLDEKTDANGTNQTSTKKRNFSTKKDPNFSLVHSPTKFEKVVAGLSEDQQQAVRDMGLGGLLSMPTKMTIKKIMCVKLAETFEVSSDTFKICDEGVPIYLEDVGDIQGLQTQGEDVSEFLKHIKSSEEQTVQTELFKRYADENKKLDIRWLEVIIRGSKSPDDDFKRAFVLFTIGLILAPTTVYTLSYNYIHVVEHVSLIKKFNWAKFTLNHLLESCRTFATTDEAILKGNLTLLQCWYWERVIVDRGVKYDNKIQPRMAMWNESNTKERMFIFSNKGIDGGTLMLSRHTIHKKNDPPEASMSQARESIHAHEEYMFNSPAAMFNSPAAEEGLSNKKMRSLEESIGDTETRLEVQFLKRCNEMEYKINDNKISQAEEFAKFKKEIKQEIRQEIRQELSRMHKFEAQNAQLKMELQALQRAVQLIMQPTPTTAHVDVQAPTQQHMPTSTNSQPSGMTTSPHLQESPRKISSKALIRINDEAPSQRKYTTENIMKPQCGPSTSITEGNPIVGNASNHIKPRQPIIETDYNLKQIDHDAAAFVIDSYEHAWVVNIDGHFLTAEHLRRNVTGAFIQDTVINAFVHLSNVENDSASYISTFQAAMIRDNLLGPEDRMKKRKTIAEKCQGKHLVFVPMHIDGNHWALLVLNFMKTEVQILNSMPQIRDEDLEKKLVEGIQYCIDYSVDRNLVKFVKPINLLQWKKVRYVEIPLQEDGTSCGAYLIKYILAWDGQHMAHDFTQDEMKLFRYRICTRLLRSERNLEFPSNGKPITKEEHYAKYPYEKEGSYSQNEDDDFQMHSPKPSTKVTPPSIAPSMKGSNGREGGKANTESGEGKEKTAPGTEITKRPRGRPRKVVDEDNTASGTEITKRPRGRPRKVVDVENTSGGSAEVKGAPKRKIAQPSKKDAANTAPTVVDEFSTESIAKSIAKRKRLPGPLQRSPFGK